MATFSLTAINVGTHALGEADRIITMFSREHGLHRAVAKGARKPGTKLSGKSEPLNINRMLLAKGRSLDIITQCESIETFGALRKNLERLTYGLYFAELTQVFGQGLSEDSERYFDRLSVSLALMAESKKDPGLLALEFEFALLDMLGLRPQLDICVACREPLDERNLSSFNHDLGGVMCRPCYQLLRRRAAGQHPTRVAEAASDFELDSDIKRDIERERARERDLELAVASISTRHSDYGDREDVDGQRASVFITPMVWKRLVLTRASSEALNDGLNEAILKAEEKSDSSSSSSLSGGGTGQQAVKAARRLMQGYIEYKAGRRMRALDLLQNLS